MEACKRRSGAGRRFSLRREGCALLLVLLLAAAALHGARAAHEPDPISAPTAEADAGEEPAAPAIGDNSSSQTEEQQQPLQQQPPLQPPPLQRPDVIEGPPPTSGNASTVPRASPAPKMATMLPLMPMVLPGCPSDDILNSNRPGVFPQKWGSMTTEAQALHPINLLFMNLAGVPSTDLIPLVTPCLYSWGIVKGSVTKIVKEYKVGNSLPMKTIVLVMRSKKAVYVVYRPTDDDWAADFDCMYTDDLRKKLNIPTPPLSGKRLQLHRGFWAAFSCVDKQVFAEVQKQLKHVKASSPFGKPQVWLVGHSLGGALAKITAFKMEHDPWFPGEVAGVVTYGSPRVGNEVWQQLYNDRLLAVTLRWHNHRDLFAALPANGQFCISNSPLKTVFSFRHVGKTALLCPSAATPGLQDFHLFPKGTEESCNTGDVLIIGTHLLGHYFDGWRRAYAAKNGLEAASVLSSGPHVRSVMCSQCALAVKQYPLPDNKAARNDGVVSCVTDASCNNKTLFSAVSWAGMFPTAFFRSDAVCDYASATCHVPSAALTQVQQRLWEMAPNITSAVANMASKALSSNPLVNQFLGLAAGIANGSMAALNGSASGNSSAAAAVAESVLHPGALAAVFGNLTGTLPAAMEKLWTTHLREGDGSGAVHAPHNADAEEAAAEEEEELADISSSDTDAEEVMQLQTAASHRARRAARSQARAQHAATARQRAASMAKALSALVGVSSVPAEAAGAPAAAPVTAAAAAADGSSSSSGSAQGAADAPAAQQAPGAAAAAAAADGGADSTITRLTGAAAGGIAEGMHAAVRPVAAALHKFSTTGQSWIGALSKILSAGSSSSSPAAQEQHQAAAAAGQPDAPAAAASAAQGTTASVTA